MFTYFDGTVLITLSESRLLLPASFHPSVSSSDAQSAHGVHTASLPQPSSHCAYSCQEHHPPRAVRSLYQVAMSGALNLQRLSQPATVGQNRILGITLVGTINISASGDGEMMRQFGATLRDQEIVISILFIYMWAFGIASAITLPEFLARRELFARLRVDFAEPDGIARIAHHVALSVFEIKRRVDALLLQPHGFAPWATRFQTSRNVARDVAQLCPKL